LAVVVRHRQEQRKHGRSGRGVEGEAMKARIVIDNAPFGPDDLEIAWQSFDSAWSVIAARYDAGDVEPAHERLAKIFLSLIPDTKDPAEIRATRSRR
jgi:hypothetical protein